MSEHTVRWAGNIMGGNALVKDLAEGERFCFPRHPEWVLTKLKGRWYRDPEGKRWQTSLLCAVVRVNSGGKE